jgi:hypothetical protein
MADSLVERLGYEQNEVVLIVSCDELGFCHAANQATYDLLRTAKATSSSLMVPAPWARAAAGDYRGEDIGVNLTIISELDLYRWGPITQAPSLLDGDGAFPRTIDDVWEHADLDEVRREWRAQIERSVLWGFNVSHLVMHFDAIELKPEFFDVYLDLAEDFRLPIRLIGTDEDINVGFPRRTLANERGVVTPDSVVKLDHLGNDADEVVASIASLGPGVHEIISLVAKDADELRGATPRWADRTEAYELLGQIDWDDLGVSRTNYAALATLMA